MYEWKHCYYIQKNIYKIFINFLLCILFFNAWRKIYKWMILATKYIELTYIHLTEEFVIQDRVVSIN